MHGIKEGPFISFFICCWSRVKWNKVIKRLSSRISRRRSRRSRRRRIYSSMNCFMKYLMADNQSTKSFDKERFTRTCLQWQSVSTDFRQPWDQALAELHIKMAYSYRMPQLGDFNRKLCANMPMETGFKCWSWNVQSFNSFTDLCIGLWKDTFLH